MFMWLRYMYMCMCMHVYMYVHVHVHVEWVMDRCCVDIFARVRSFFISRGTSFLS